MQWTSRRQHDSELADSTEGQPENVTADAMDIEEAASCTKDVEVIPTPPGFTCGRAKYGNTRDTKYF